MEIKGRPTIHPWLFYTGKTAGYLTWLILYLTAFHFYQFVLFHSRLTDLFTVAFLIFGLVFIILSLAFLGKSVRLGLPTEQTEFKTGGIYQISRNPMYIGLHFFTLASMVYTLHPLVMIMGIYSFVVYHLIILGEERFLTERFGETYKSYQQKVRRYI
jgi:protein-S-isoprenylcysteine O-methyltransferase Ste14